MVVPLEAVHHLHHVAQLLGGVAEGVPDASDTSESEGEGESSPSSASASDFDPDAAWGKDETAMETRERLGLVGGGSGTDRTG